MSNQLRTPPPTRSASEAARKRQLSAADPASSVWVSANAGTGKTRVLVDRILRLLLAGTRPERILCLTFTKAAAAEMANRLSETLAAWVVASDNDLNTALIELLGRKPEDAETATARRLFADVLETPGGLRLRTIHAFCESLLGRFPLEAGLAPHFTVADERTAAELLREARDRILPAAGGADGDALAAALETIAGLVDETDFETVMAHLAQKRGSLSALLRRYGSGPALAQAARRAMGLAPGEDMKAVLTATAQDEAFDGAGLERAARALDHGSNTDRKRAAILRAWLTRPETRVGSLADTYRDAFLTKKDEPRKTLATKAVLEADPEVVSILLAEQTRLLAMNKRLKAAAVAEATEALIVVAERLLATFEMLKHEHALLDYDDLVLAARDLLTASDAAWVHFKLDGGIDHILVDEAQDTAPAQWEVVVALAAEFFAGLGAHEEPRTVFAVGDEKQSIFSFQGADPEAFAAMQEHFEARARDAGRPWREIEMPVSFRSVWTVLKAVDRVFAGEAAADGLSFLGRPIRHLSSRAGQAGRVEIWPTVTPEETPESDPWDAPLDRLPAASPPARLAERIAETIAGWIARNEILESAGRPIRPGDIMILVRKRRPFGEEMVRALKARNIPVAGADRMVLTEQMAVMDLMALGRFALLPEDDLSLAEVLKSPLIGLDDDDLFRLAHRRRGTLWQALGTQAKDDPRLKAARTRLAGWLTRADFVPPFEFYADLLGPGGGRRALVGRLGGDAHDPLDEFLNLALDFEREHAPSLQGFLRWLEAGATTIKRDMEYGRDEVRVLTVHGAKGLQAEIVFLPDTCGTPGGRDDDPVLWPEEDPPALLWPGFRAQEDPTCRDLRDAARHRALQEHRRLLYVAMTRAEERLYVCGFEGTRGRAEGCWYDLVSAALDGKGVAEVPLPWNETARRLEDPRTAPRDRAAGKAAAPKTAALPPAWLSQPAPDEPTPPRPLMPSRPEADEPPVRSPLAEDGAQRFQRGLVIHRLLQSLPDLPETSRAKAARAFTARPPGRLDPAEAEAVVAEVLRLLDDPTAAILFGPDSRAEVPLAGRIGGHAVAARLDRLVVTPGRVIVADFKTHRSPPAEAARVAPMYLRQMAVYRALLRRIFPAHTVECCLVWTDGPSLMPLPDTLLDAHAP